MDYIQEVRRIPVVMECDVLVAGGGIAGIAAALSSAREGAKVILCEKQVLLGGLATLGLVTIYLPLCDGNAHQIVYGIGEELFRLSIKNGIEGREPTAWLSGGTEKEKREKRFEVQYNPHFFGVEAEQLLLREGIEILYDTRISDVKVDNSKIGAVIIENKSGRSAIHVKKSVVDATGDADIFSYADAKTALYTPQNVLANWHYVISKNKLHLCMNGAINNVGCKSDFRFSGIDGFELSKAVQITHKAFLDETIKFRESIPDYTPVTLPTIPQVRMSRRLVGGYDIDIKDDHKYFEDSIGMIPSWKNVGPVFEIPLRALYGNEVKNLIAAGRCISATDEMWDLTRVIPACAVTGEAAGLVAAMYDDFLEADIFKIQHKLKLRNVKLHIPEIL